MEIPQWASLGFQDASSITQEQMMEFHDHCMIILVTILMLVGYTMVSALVSSFSDRNLAEGQSIEFIWTIIPALILLVIAFPSLRLLYLMEEAKSPDISVKVVGHQWYWSYEYSDFKDIDFDSYMISCEDLPEGGFRLLEADNRMVVPMNSSLRVLITAADVLHSWTVPSLGVKADAIPGRLNQISVSMARPGVYYGQCSEICGANHSFMPIVVESVDSESFTNWVKSY